MTARNHALWVARNLRLPERQVVILLWLLAFAVRVVFLLRTGSYENVEFGEANHIAISLAQSGRFANPFGIETGPTAHTAPLFPFLLSLLIRLTGDVTRAELFKQIIASALSATTYALLPNIARRLNLSVAASLVVASTFAVLPLFAWVEIQTWWDHLFAAVLMMLICAHVYELLQVRTRHTGRAFAAGLLAGTLVLVYPPTLFAVLALAVVYFGRSTLPRPERTKHLAIIFSVGALVLSPWIINRSLALGGFVFLRTGHGIALGMAFNPDAARFSSIEDTEFDEVVHRRYSPNSSNAERQKVAALGELAYNQVRADEARAWIRTHPVEAAALIARRVLFFWFPTDRRPWRQVAQAGITLAGLIGFVVMWRERHPALLILFPALMAFSFPYYIVQMSVRYRHPILWILLLAGAHGIHRGLLLWRDAPERRGGTTRGPAVTER